MRQGYLRDGFAGVGAKRLVAVDSDPEKSNQHEINTTKKMRQEFLGEEDDRRFPAKYIWLEDDREPLEADSHANHYDARRNHPSRSEWRLYYTSNPVTEMMGEGDSLFLALERSGHLYFIVAQRGSTSERQLCWLFGVQPEDGSFMSRSLRDDATELGFPARFVLGRLGLEPELPEADRLDSIVEPFGTEFPTTAAFSETARGTLRGVEPRDDPDLALVKWVEHEEALFRRLERKIVEVRLQEGFVADGAVDVDGFVGFSLSVHNRRKSRMGHSLEHHLAAVFKAYELRFDRQKVTERGHKPDFLFPSIAAYRAAPDEGWPCLVMMGAKSTCKERWRQVLTEAAKIRRKHLLTLEPSISSGQTDQMKDEKLQLVVPQPVHQSYSASQQEWLWTLGGFIEHVRGLQ